MAPAPKQRKGICMLVRLYLWFISLFERDHSTKTNEEKAEPLGLNLQFFSDNDNDDDNGDNDDSDDDDDSEDEEDAPDLDELLKDPEFKKQYNKRLKKQLGKRMKKFDGIDPEEFRRLKERAGRKKDKQGNEDDNDEEVETLRDELNQKEKKLLRAERREKRAMVKEYAVDNQVNPKLLSRLINVDDIELDDDGEADNLDDLFDELEEEFPEYFGTSDDEDGDDEDDEPRKKKRKSTYVPGARKKGNNKKKVDPYEAGRQKALERHKKEDK